jgi:alpha-ketoglutarate-dependent taurine dioxygenase
MQDHLTLEPAWARGHLPDASLPLVLRYSGAGRGFREARAAIADLVRRELKTAGAILFRGFGVETAAEFEEVVQSTGESLVHYEFGSTPRSLVQGRVYTSTEYPAHQSIPLHNEQAYTREWPLEIWFFCAQPAPEGGATPLADSREVYRRVPADIRRRFEAKGVMYVRNYGNGLDVPWQKVFQTDDRAQVNEYCVRARIECEWKPDGELRTRQTCQAVADHPGTGERVWFNQAHLFHVSSLEPRVRSALLGVVAEQNLPRNAYYGDGTPIPEADLDRIRQAYRETELAFAWEKGDVLAVDNMLVAHGRSPFRGPRRVLVAMTRPHAPAIEARGAEA